MPSSFPDVALGQTLPSVLLIVLEIAPSLLCYFATTVYDDVIRIPLKWVMRIILLYPLVKGMVQVQVGQQGTDLHVPNCLLQNSRNDPKSN